MDWQRVAKRVRAERRAAGYRTQKAAHAIPSRDVEAARLLELGVLGPR
jgi:hypothetical protein